MKGTLINVQYRFSQEKLSSTKGEPTFLASSLAIDSRMQLSIEMFECFIVQNSQGLFINCKIFRLFF